MACSAFALGLLHVPPNMHAHDVSANRLLQKRFCASDSGESGGHRIGIHAQEQGAEPVVRRVAKEIAADHLAALASVVRILLHAEKACDSRILRNSQQLKGAEAFRSSRVLRNTHGTHAPTLLRVHRKRPSQAPMRRIPSLKPPLFLCVPDAYASSYACASGHATL